MIAEMRRQINALTRQVAALSKIRIEGFARSGGGASGGLSFTRSVQRSADPHYTPPKTVVIVKTPTQDDIFLTVREARYTTDIPKPCTGDGESVVCHYEWFGPELEVFAPLGTKPIDFAGDEFDHVVDDTHPPKFSTVFHRVHREHEVWVLEAKPEGGAIEPVIILASMPVNTPTAKFLTIRPAKENPTTHVWEADPTGEPKVVETWFNHQASHYLPMVGLAPLLVGAMTKIKSSTRLLPNGANLRMFIATATQQYGQSDCPVVNP